MRGIGKKGIAVESLIWWLIAISVLVIILVLSITLKDKLFEMARYLKDLF